MPEKHRRQKRRAAARGRVPDDGGQPKKDTARPVLTGRRVWLFRLAALVVGPALFLGLLEIGLRAAGYGYNPHVAVDCRVDGKPCRGENVMFGRRFFTTILAREFEPFVFPVVKPPDTCRIFVLGESAAQGIPNSSFCFGRLLQVMLRAQFPDIRFEVITVAMSAINSHAVLQVARDCARYDPDLFIVYLGNNEVIGPYGPGTVFTPTFSSLRLIRLNIALRTTKIGQLLAGLLGDRESGNKEPSYWKGMEMCVAEKVRADDPRLQVVYHHFQRNLEDICRAAAGAGAQTVVCTVASNVRDCPPFSSAHRPDLTPEQQASWDVLYQKGVQREQQSDYAGAVDYYLQAARLDDSYADLQFRLGRCYGHQGDHDNARPHYIRARDGDTLRFRTDTEMNEIIRRVASRWEGRGVYLADVAGALNTNSPGGLAGHEFFYEHVHFTFEGSCAVAATILGQVEPVLSARFPDRLGRRGAQPTWSQCADAVGYNEWSRAGTYAMAVDSFLLKPPFINQLYHQEWAAQAQQELRTIQQHLTPNVLQLVCRQFEAAIEKDPEDWRLRWDYGKLLAEDLKQYDAAVAQYEAVLHFLAHSYIAHDALAAVLRAKGDLDRAIAEYRRTLAIKPTCGRSWYWLGSCYRAQGKNELAAEQYRRAIRFEPPNTGAYLQLGELLFQEGKLREAEQICRQGLVVVPDDPLLHCNLGTLLVKTNRPQEGAEEIHTALRLDPNSPRIQRIARILLGPAGAEPPESGPSPR
jgi:tetratricopeptide (TPR) repeat protein